MGWDGMGCGTAAYKKTSRGSWVICELSWEHVSTYNLLHSFLGEFSLSLSRALVPTYLPTSTTSPVHLGTFYFSGS